MSERTEYKRIHRYRKRQALLAYLGGVCVRCGFDDSRALQVDHVNGDGASYIQHNNVYSLFNEVQKHPNMFQLLCSNCNWIKREENEEYAHTPYTPTDEELGKYRDPRREYAERVVDQLLSGELSRHNAIERLKVVIF